MTSAGRQKTVVSVTPLRLDHDSRAWRAAATFLRFGFTSILAEGQTSDIDRRDLPFRLISLGPDDPVSVREKNGPNGRFRAIKRQLRQAVGPTLWGWGALSWTVAQIYIVNVVRGILRVPRADVYYLHEYKYFPMVAVLARLHGAAIIYDAHDFYPEVHGDSDMSAFWKRRFVPFLSHLERRCIDGAQVMLTINQGIAELYRRRFGVSPHVARNCHDARLDRPVDRGLRERLGLGKDRFLIVTVGNAKPNQAVVQALDAMTALPGRVNLAFLGNGYEAVREATASRGLEGRVHVHPAVPANQVVPLLRGVDAALILYGTRTANDENMLPNGFFQTVAAGLPLVYPRLKWIRQIADKYELGREIDSPTPDAIAGGVAALMQDLERHPSMFADNLARAASENSWAYEEAILIQAVEKALARA